MREIAAQADPPVSQAAICRFKLSVSRKTQAAVAKAKTAIAYRDMGLDADSAQAVARAALTVATDPFLFAVEQLRIDRQRIKGKAETADDLRAWVAADRNDLTALELHARLAGRLDAAPTGERNTFVLVPIAVPCLAQPAAPAIDAEWREVTPDEVGNQTGESE